MATEEKRGPVPRRQFTLAYLFLEIFWVAAALGMSRLVAFSTTDPEASLWEQTPLLWMMLVFTTLVCWCIAIGGMFGRMTKGAVFGLAVVAVSVLLPCVLYVLALLVSGAYGK